MNTKKVWLVTGASKGLGLTLAKKLLKEGYRVAATSRDLNALTNAISTQTDQFLPLQVDILNEDSVAGSVTKIIDTFGSIDVLVNNAGYGQLGTLEEITDKEVRSNFEVNVYGSLNIIRKVMPQMRKQRSGAVFNISSIGGFTGNFPGWGIYCATKFAVAGFTESLSAEAKPFGVSATIVYPGYFRTEFLSDDSLRQPINPIAEYEDARVLEAKHKKEIDGNQPGDPEKAADVLIKVAETQNPPLHLFLGEDAFDIAYSKIAELQKDLAAFKTLSVSTSF